MYSQKSKNPNCSERKSKIPGIPYHYIYPCCLKRKCLAVKVKGIQPLSTGSTSHLCTFPSTISTALLRRVNDSFTIYLCQLWWLILLGCHMFESRLSSKREKPYVTPPQQGSGHSPPGPVGKNNIRDLSGWICVTTLLVSDASPFLRSCETPCGNRTAWLTSARQPPAFHLRTR